MSNEDYLRNVLKSQQVLPGSPEMKALESARREIEALIRGQFEDSAPSIRYGGSKAKGTMVLADYDLDLISYFRHDDKAAGETIAEIYGNMRSVLAIHYAVDARTSALRVRTQDRDDLHVDVVPGRFVDDSRTTAYLHQNGGSKKYIKTDIGIHIDHVKNSGCSDIICLAKLWNVENSVGIRTFPLELAVIKALSGQKKVGLSERFGHVLKTFAWDIDKLSIEDPANPTGNDLSDIFDGGVRYRVAQIARDTLAVQEQSGWESVFTLAEAAANDIPKVTVLTQAAEQAPHNSGPWCEKS